METLLYILLGLYIILMISYVFSDKNEKFNLLLMISLVFPIISLSEKIGND
jgi:ABC-type microcin C transport system permease subunit YejE